MFDKIKELLGKDDNVKKFVFTKEDAVAEAVLYKYPTYEERTVICCSTQSGCPVGCTFCGTGASFVRSLTSTEICSQVYYCINSQKIDADEIAKFQIMFMSMGEPMLNSKALIEAMRELSRIYPNASLLVSTMGPNTSFEEFFSFSEECDKVGLQFSVHESTEEARGKLIPMKNRRTLKQIASLGIQFFDRTGRRPYFNYCVHENNNSYEDANRLEMLFNPDIWEATISVICEKDETVQSSIERQDKLARDFSDKLLNVGFSTRVFNPAGQDDIGGGCGQLWESQKWMKEHKNCVKPRK